MIKYEEKQHKYQSKYEDKLQAQIGENDRLRLKIDDMQQRIQDLEYDIDGLR